VKHKYFSIVTKDVARLSEFYKTILHAELNGINDLDNYVEYYIDDFVFCVESVASVESRSGTSFSAFSAGSVIIEFEVDKVDEEYSRLRQLGVKVFRKPFDNPWGTRNFYFNDLDGNLVCFYTNIREANHS
jgi:predicted enzyme related to lactoylglutathione lyase